jgi:AraC-like DNA-binding protein
MQSIFSEAKASDLKRIQWNSEGGIRLELLGLVDFPRDYRGALHTHSFWELIYINSGKGQVKLGDKVQACSADEILLVQPGTSHQFLASGLQSLEQFYVGFSFDFPLPEDHDHSELMSLPSGPFTDLVKSELKESLSRIKQYGDGPTSDAIRGRILPLVSRIIGFLTSFGTGYKVEEMGQYPSLIRMTKEYLMADLRKVKTVTELAHNFCLSPQYFGEIFKRQTGLSIKEYQRKIRMERAMELLRESSLSIMEIGEAVGFEDQAYFSRIFKNQYEVSPRKIRNPATTV